MVYTYIVMCIEHQQLQRWVRLSTLPIARGDDTTHWLSDKSYRHRLPPPLNAQSDTRWQPRLWPTESSQRSTPVPKVSLGGEEKQQWHHVLCTTDVWTCRGPPVQAMCNRLFELSLSQRAKPNVTSNATINVVMPLNTSKRQCHSTITITMIATIMVTCQHTKPIAPE